MNTRTAGGGCLAEWTDQPASQVVQVPELVPAGLALGEPGTVHAVAMPIVTPDQPPKNLHGLGREPAPGEQSASALQHGVRFQEAQPEGAAGGWPRTTVQPPVAGKNAVRLDRLRRVVVVGNCRAFGATTEAGDRQ